MQIRKDGIFKTIDAKDYGIYQSSGWEKVIADVKPTKAPEPIIVEEEKPVIDELPKSKKKKK